MSAASAATSLPFTAAVPELFRFRDEKHIHESYALGTGFPDGLVVRLPDGACAGSNFILRTHVL